MLKQLTEQILATTALEWISTVSQVVSVWFAQRNSVWVYPIGLIGVAIASHLCVAAGLYADAGLNAYYSVMSIYGWWIWLRKDPNTRLDVYPIRWCRAGERTWGFGIAVVSCVVLYFVLKTFTPSTVPWGDAFVSATAVAAMWWMARRTIENWVAYMVSNSVAVPLFYFKGLVLFSLMYAVFLVMAIRGFFLWKKQIRISPA